LVVLFNFYITSQFQKFVFPSLEIKLLEYHMFIIYFSRIKRYIRKT